MTFPFVTAITAGSLLILQMLLGFLTSGARATSGHGATFDITLPRAV